MPSRNASVTARLCKLLCLCSKSGDGDEVIAFNWSQSGLGNQSGVQDKRDDIPQDTVITEPLLSHSASPTILGQDPTEKCPRFGGLQPERGTYSHGGNSHSSRKQSTILCFSKRSPRPNQVDLCPRSWFGLKDKKGGRSGNVHDNHDQNQEEENEDDLATTVCDIIWRSIFFLTCFPLCYPCYICRTLRRMSKTSYSEYDFLALCKQRRPRAAPFQSPLVYQAQDQMGRTMMRQVCQAKKPLKTKVEIETDPSSEARLESIQEELPTATKVIQVNVILLHSKTSCLLHRHLSTKLPNFNSVRKSTSFPVRESASGTTSPSLTETDGGMFHMVQSAPESLLKGREGSFLSVPRPQKRQSENQGGRKSKPKLDKLLDENGTTFSEGDDFHTTAGQNGGGIVIHFSTHGKLDPVLEEERAPGTLARPIEGDQVDATRRSSSSSNSELFHDCLETIPISAEVQRPTIVISNSLVAVEADEAAGKPQMRPIAEEAAKKRKSSSVAVRSWQKLRGTIRSASTIRASSGAKEESGRLSCPGEMSEPIADEKESESLSNSGSDPVVFRSGPSGARARKAGTSKPSSHDMEAGRTELIKDLGFQLSFGIFDEASVSQWKGCDLRLANEIPNMDLIVLPVRQNHLSELNEVLNTESGVMSYVGKFWLGFYPLLLIELQPDTNSTNSEGEKEPTQSELSHDSDSDAEYSRTLNRINHLFGDIHHIKIVESELGDNIEWITECMARLFIHARLYQCSRFYGEGLHKLERCPGGCELKKIRSRKRGLVRQNAFGRPVRFSYKRVPKSPTEASTRISSPY
eukprot:snap_masked-scaffold183_size276960-processed-gene-0.6 protein:Tk01752 transcript:snap_masked-scaffold183_size276960-processed-gene-0.6-mRNA-1 annotation:"---NA---"